MLAQLKLTLLFGPTRRAQFYKLLADYVKDGTDVVTAVKDMHRMYDAMRDGRRKITQDILYGYRGGNMSRVSVPFGKTLSRYVPPVEAIAVDAADGAGETERGLNIAKDAALVAGRVRSTIWSLMSTPLFLVVAAIGVLIFLRMGLIPGMEELMPRSRWPAGPAFLGKLTDAVPVGVPVLVGLAALYLGSFVYVRDRWAGTTRDWVDRYVFPFTLNREIAMGGVLSSIAVMVRSGIPFSNAIERLRDNSPRWHKYHLAKVLIRLREGAADGEALGPLFRGEAKFRIEAYGRRSTFHAAMTEISGEINELLLQRLHVQFGVVALLSKAAIAGLITLGLTSSMSVALAVRSTAGS